MGRITRGWALAKASWRVLLGEKRLLIFTALSGLCTLIALAAFVAPAVAIANVGGDAARDHDSFNPVALVLVFAFYLVTSFITLFFNTALIGAVLEKLRGGEAQIGDGFRIAGRNLPSIVVFSLISATVGTILYAIEERFRFVGQIVAAVLGGVWGVVTFLVVPVMVAEGRNPFAAIRRSAALLKRTWGEQIVGSGGIGLVTLLVGLPGVLPAVLGIASGEAALIGVGVAVSALYLCLIALIGSTLSQIFRATVYVYADTGAVPQQFDAWMLQGAFSPKP